MKRTNLMQRQTAKVTKLFAVSILTAAVAGCSNQDNTDKQVSELQATDKSKSQHQVMQDVEKVVVSGSRIAEQKQQAAMTARASANRQVQAEMAQNRMRNFAVPMSPLVYSPPPAVKNTEKYASVEENGIILAAEQSVSTFSIDVDTGSYSNVRRMLNQGVLPPADAVRVEEFVNYFDFNYSLPDVNSHPFKINTALTTSPWNSEKHLLRIGLKGFEPDPSEVKGSNLVFLLDVSGSMNSPQKLPLLKKSLQMLTHQLDAEDRVSMVVYAGASGVVLEPTPGNNHNEIVEALNRLQAGGSTNGESGIRLAYNMAKKAFIKNGTNRVILATDGDFNVGTVDQKSLIDMIKAEKQNGIALTTLGFGQGNYNDDLMEQLADHGDGNYAYIDTINEARKVLVDELYSTSLTLAKDVKIQVEFNPNVVAEYRLIGYENRALNREDFKNDKVDAGEIGAGHTVTALYELALQTSNDKAMDALRYQQPDKTNTILKEELAQVKLRYKPMDKAQSVLLTKVVNLKDSIAFEKQSEDVKFATAVVAFAEYLRDSRYSNNVSLTRLIEIANESKGEDKFGYRSEFIQLVRTAQALKPNTLLSKTSQ